ncbi:MAG: TadE family protein, partial [Planctomycetota bacterium]
MITTHRPERRGSAAVEFLILFPVLLLVIIAMLYLGDLSQFLLHTHFGADYAMHAAGDQSEAKADRGTITSLLFPNPIGALTVAERPLPDGDLPRAGELRDMFDEMSEPIYSVRATGRYVLQDGQLRFIVHTHQDEALSAEGRYVQRYGLRDDQIPELTTGLTQGWAHRQRVDLDYAYEPDYIRVGKWPLEAVDLSARFE